jgi:uracil-DNA glycosylase family 4
MGLDKRFNPRESKIVLGPDSLEKIAAEVSSCPLCELCRTRKKAVPGEGSLSAKLMIVGEAPGRTEDKTGRPFVGAAGRILDRGLRKAGIGTSQVFITNVVKCRPPSNRLPYDSEQAACKPYLKRQIALIKPNIICLLGSTAYRSILGGKSIMRARGKVIKRDEQTYFVSIHPAAAIYKRRFLNLLDRDLEKLSKLLKRGRKT